MLNNENVAGIHSDSDALSSLVFKRKLVTKIIQGLASRAVSDLYRAVSFPPGRTQNLTLKWEDGGGETLVDREDATVN